MPTMKDLLAQQTATEQAFEAARDLAETLANQENESLINDETYISWTRRKKLAEREVVRLEAAVATIADEILAETGRLEQEALQKRYAAVKARNEEVQIRLRKYGTEGVVDLLKLLRDLAQDEIDVAAINSLVPWNERLRFADEVVRCAPSVQPTEDYPYFKPADEVVSLWKTIYVPRLGDRGQRLYDGKEAWAPQKAIERINFLLGE